MNLLSNISMQTAMGTGNTQKTGIASGSKQTPQQGMLGFLNLVLGQSGAQNSANIGDLSAKIAQLLKSNPTDQAGLQKLIETFAPNTSPELSAQIAQALQGMVTAQGPQAKPGLISDLTAMLVNDIQDPSALNNMAALDPAVMAELQKKFEAFQQSGNAANPAAFAQFKADLITMLGGKGFSADKIQQYLAGFAKTLRQASAENMPLSDALASTEQKPGIAAKTSPAAQISAAPAMQTQHAQTTQQAPQTKAVAATSNLALVNGMASGDKASFGGDFGQQGAFSQNNFADGSALMKQTAEANTQGFVNYMAAAKGNGSAMTQMVSLQIQRNAAAKVDTFTLQLDPAELGRLDVQLKFDRDGGVKAHLVADRAETLALLQRDSSQLEKMLQQAGLDVDSSGLSFDLREQGKQAFEREASGSDNTDGDFATHMNGGGEDKILAAKIAVEAYGYITPTSVNIMV